MSTDMELWVSRQIAQACVEAVVGVPAAMPAAVEAATQYGHMAFVWSVDHAQPPCVAAAISTLMTPNTAEFAAKSSPRPPGQSRRAALWELTHPEGDSVHRMFAAVEQNNDVPVALQQAISPEFVAERAKLLNKLCRKFGPSRKDPSAHLTEAAPAQPAAQADGCGCD